MLSVTSSRRLPGGPRPGARLRPSARRRLPPQVRAAGVGAAGGSRVLRPRRQRAPQVAAAPARRSHGDLRDELPQVRRRRRGGVAALPPPRAAHRPAEARGRDGRARASRSSTRPASRSRASSRRSRASSRSSRPRSRGSSRRTSTSRSTSSRRRRRSGTPSRCSASGGVRRPRTEPGRVARLRVVAFVLVVAGVVTWDAVAPHLGEVCVWREVAIIAAGVLPATLLLIYLALPLWSKRLDRRGGVRRLRDRRRRDVGDASPPRLELPEARRLHRAEAGCSSGCSRSSPGWS